MAYLLSQPLLRNIIICVVIFIVGLVIGVLSGYFGRGGSKDAGEHSQLVREADPEISQLLLNEVKAENIRQNLKDYASHPHLAGTPADQQQALKLKQQWLGQGLDRVDIVDYDVLLSYPVEGDPNVISLLQADGTQLFESQKEERMLRPEDFHEGDEIVPPFNAYSAPGDLTSEKLVYVNYAREEDFHWLKHNKSVNFTGTVVIARYGRIFRGDKVAIATEYGASAVILYTDPFDYSSPSDNSSYPNSWWLPGTGVQRGTVKDIGAGDPTTPFYPSIESAYRVDTTNRLPRIPVQPVGYDDAKHLLQQLGGELAPESWKGSIPGLTYRLGGSFTTAGMVVNVHVTTRNVRRRTYNVIGYIEGAVEPDRYVVVGNHRDGWVYGAVDPSSSTAALIEATRTVTTVMKESGWRPRRTLVFCSWGAEEHGLLGSSEFTEHFAKVLSQRAVAYLNADVLLEGTDYLRLRASPMLHTTVYKAAKKISNPNPDEVSAGRTTAYDTWLHMYPSAADPNVPGIKAIGSGSDYSSFQNVLGIPCLEPRYTWDKKKWRISSYPLYHSVYETFYLVDQLIDPGFKLSRAVTQVWVELMREISDSLILPLDPKTFSNFISTESQKLLDANEALMRRNNLTSDIDYFKAAIGIFQKEVDGFIQRSAKVDKRNPYSVREINDKLMNLHRSFLDPQGLAGREMFKNVLLAPSAFNSYSGAVFPSITDSLHRIESNTDPEKWKKVRKNLSIVTYFIHTAAATLRESHKFTDL